MEKLKKDFSCILRDKTTGKDLLTFTAQQVGNPVYSAGFEGGGVASGSQALSIITETGYAFNPLQHDVWIDGKRWILMSFYPSIRRKLGAGWASKSKTYYVLNLE